MQPIRARSAPAGDEAVDFLAMAAHELRGPVTVIVGLADTLHNLWGTDQFDEVGEEMLGTLARGGRRLLHLVNDLLTSAYLEHGAVAIELDAVPVLPILQWAVSSTSRGDRDLTIDCDPSVHAKVDADRLEQIVTNLVTNALRHGEGPVEVRAAEHPLVMTVRIEVRDHGKGVAVEDVPYLFERFSRLSHHDESSSGLGLAIARDLARAMGGDLTYERADPGSRFVLTLPAPS